MRPRNILSVGVVRGGGGQGAGRQCGPKPCDPSPIHHAGMAREEARSLTWCGGCCCCDERRRQSQQGEHEEAQRRRPRLALVSHGARRVRPKQSAKRRIPVGGWLAGRSLFPLRALLCVLKAWIWLVLYRNRLASCRPTASTAMRCDAMHAIDGYARASCACGSIASDGGGMRARDINTWPPGISCRRAYPHAMVSHPHHALGRPPGACARTQCAVSEPAAACGCCCPCLRHRLSSAPEARFNCHGLKPRPILNVSGALRGSFALQSGCP